MTQERTAIMQLSVNSCSHVDKRPSLYSVLTLDLRENVVGHNHPGNLVHHSDASQYLVDTPWEDGLSHVR